MVEILAFVEIFTLLAQSSYYRYYLISLIIAGIDNLQTRREHLTVRFFLRNALKEKSSLHYLLPIKRDLNTVNRLRHAKTFELSQTRTERFRRSFIPYSLAKYQ